MEHFKYLGACVGGAIMAYFKQYWILYIFVAVAVIFDLVTGMTAAYMEGTGLSSKVARNGFLKKMILLISVGFGTFLDMLLPFAAQKIGLDIPQTLLFSAIICVYICITECISIVENIYRCTGNAMPGWILKMLKQYKDNIEQNGDGKNDR